MSLQSRLYQILEPAQPGDIASRRFDAFLVLLIFANVIAVILESVAAIHQLAPAVFANFELFSVAVFSVEYLGRVWVATQDPRYQRSVTGRLRYMLSPMALVDLLAVLPFYLAFLGVDLRFVRAFRLFRIVRLLKIARYTRVVELFRAVWEKSRDELVVALGMMLLLLVITAGGMYYAEHEVQPEAFSSIPATMWWAVATLTTVGYGDVYPVTRMGRLFGGCVAVIGIGMFALPTGILGSAFVEEVRARKQAKKGNGPHCGRPMHDA